ncbi:MAG: hypothetical protein R3B46_00340 [Phycisphaerales bacterium]
MGAKILIVESLSPEDLLDDWCEARATKDILRTINVQAHCERARSQEELETICRMFAYGKFDVLHIACHGCDNGIELSDGTSVDWSKLANMLGDSLADKMLVLSACKGGCSNLPRVFQSIKSRPARIIGPHEDVDWDRLVIGLQVFYRSVFPPDGSKSDLPCVAVSRAELASGPGFVLHEWDETAGLYKTYGPSPLCSLDVMIKTHGEDAVTNAASFLDVCCGQKWDGPVELLESLKKLRSNLTLETSLVSTQGQGSCRGT